MIILMKIQLVSFVYRFYERYLLVEIFVVVYRKPFSPLVVVIGSHQLNPIDEQQYRSDKPLSSARNQKRPMPTSDVYWLKIGDDDNSAHFMRSTYTATCRSRTSRSVERCPRACRGILPFP